MGIPRRFDLAQYKRSGPEVVVGTDASPYGLGGWIAVDGHIQHYFFCAISSHDEEIYGVARGTSIGQQIWECLAVLVALRLWWAIIRKYRCNLAVRLDNVGALSLVLKLRPHGAAQTIIARELALLLIECPFEPTAIHTPGASHTIADKLSRAYATGQAGDN